MPSFVGFTMSRAPFADFPSASGIRTSNCGRLVAGGEGTEPVRDDHEAMFGPVRSFGFA